jgi:hypothetical protein
MTDREPVTVIQATHIIHLHKLRTEYVATITVYDDKGKTTDVMIGKDADAMTAITLACKEAGI